MSKLLSLLYLSYPLAMHFAIPLGHLSLALFWLGGLLVVSAVRERLCLKKFTPAFFVYLLFATVVFVLAGNYPEQLAKFIPLIIYTSLFSLFAVSLGAGKVPLITAFASLMRGQAVADLHPQVQRYTRRLTLVWCGLFLLLGVSSLLLALYAPIYLWSLFSNVISYIIIGLVFLLEIGIRKRLVGEHMDYAIKDFLQRLAAVDFSHLFRPSK